MTNTKILLLMLFLAASVGMCLCWAEDVQQGAGNAMHDAKKTIESGAGLPHDKSSKNHGMKQEEKEEVARNIRSKAGDAASRTTEKEKSAAYEKSSEAADLLHKKSKDFDKSASEKAGKTAEMEPRVKELGKEKAGQVHGEQFRDGLSKSLDGFKKKLHMPSKEPKEDANEWTKHNVQTASGEWTKHKVQTASNEWTKHKVQTDPVENGKGKATHDEAKKGYKMASSMAADKSLDVKDEAAESYDKAKHKVGETYMDAKETETEGAKARYEAAKEKESQAAGDLGAKMRNEGKEL